MFPFATAILFGSPMLCPSREGVLTAPQAVPVAQPDKRDPARTSRTNVPAPAPPPPSPTRGLTESPLYRSSAARLIMDSYSLSKSLSASPVRLVSRLIGGKHPVDNWLTF